MATAVAATMASTLATTMATTMAITMAINMGPVRRLQAFWPGRVDHTLVAPTHARLGSIRCGL